MIAVNIYRPLHEDDIWLFRVEQFANAVVVSVVDNRATVILVGKDGPGLEDLARLLRFCGPHCSTIFVVGRPAIALPAIEIEKNNLMPQVRVSRDCAPAATLRIAGMAPAYNYLQLAPSLAL